MSDLPDPMEPHVPDPLADLKAQIESELAHGKYNEEQLAELHDIRAEYAERIDDIVGSHAADLHSITDDVRTDATTWGEEHADGLAAHHVEPRDIADLMQPVNAASIDHAE